LSNSKLLLTLFAASAGSFFREDRKIAPGFEKMEDGEDMFEEEEKDLVAWTNSLNEDTI